MKALVLFAVAILAVVSASAGGKPAVTGVKLAISIPSSPIIWREPAPSPGEDEIIFPAGDEESLSVSALRLPGRNWVRYTLWAIVPAEGVLEADSVVARFDDGTPGEVVFEKGNWLVPMGTHDAFAPAFAPASDSIPPPPTDPAKWDVMHRTAVLTPGE